MALRNAVAACVAIVLWGTGVGAETVVPLQPRRIADVSDACASVAGRYLTTEGLSFPRERGSVAAYDSRIAGQEVTILVDSSDPDECHVSFRPDRSDAQPLARVLRRRENGRSYCVFGPLTVRAGAEPGGRDVAVHVEARELAPGFVYVRLYPAAMMSGRAGLAGRAYAVAVVDGNLDGRYDGVYAGDRDTTDCDWLAIDRNGDGRINKDIYAAAEIMPLPSTLSVGNAFYATRVASDGSSIAFTPTQPQMGALNVGTRAAELQLLSDYGPVVLRGGGPWQLPAGGYRTTSIQLVARDQRGTEWKLKGGSSRGELNGFRVEAGQTTAIKVGPPLVFRSEATDLGRDQVSVGCKLVGSAGEEYEPGAYRNGRQQKPPKFRIIDENGTVGVSDSFEYG